MMQNNILKNLKEKIKKQEEISPVLFVGEDFISMNLEISEIIEELLKEFGVDKSSVFRFEDNGEKIKIETSREIIEKLSKKSAFKFQIILIENISRFTLAGANSLLKIFEEPGVGNIIFLTNYGENNILETILSRVTIVKLNYRKNFLIDEKIFSMLENYFEYDNPEILYYLYENSKKFDKYDYFKIIDNAIEFCKKKLSTHPLIPSLKSNGRGKYSNYLEKFLELKNLNLKNNFSLKYGIDKILL